MTSWLQSGEGFGDEAESEIKKRPCARHGQSDREEMSDDSTAFEPTGIFTLAHKG
jgi:hypothetical protein